MTIAPILPLVEFTINPVNAPRWGKHIITILSATADMFFSENDNHLENFFLLFMVSSILYFDCNFVMAPAFSFHIYS